MKRNLLSQVAAALIFGAAVVGCTTQPHEELQFLDLSQISCTFLGKDGKAVMINVKASTTDWKASTEAAWLKAVRSEDGRTLTITAQDNNDVAERFATIKVTADRAVQEIQVNQLGTDSSFNRYRRLASFRGGVVSPNGKFIGGYTEEILPDDSSLFTPTIIDTETGEVHYCTPIPQAVHWLSDPIAISNQGVLFIDDSVSGGQIAIDTNDNIFVPEAVEGFRNLPHIQAISEDGRYWVGYARNAPLGEGMYYPILWTDGVAKVLSLPEKNFRGEEFRNGVMARGMSNDGKIIYGTTWDNYDFGMVYWKEGEVKYVGHDVHEIVPGEIDKNGTKAPYNFANGIICMAEVTKISPSGNWIAGAYRVEVETETSGIVGQYAAFFNTETGKTTVVRDYGESAGMHVTDDGIAFIGIGTIGVSTGKVYDLNTGTDLGSTEDWILDRYGIDVPEGYVKYVSPDRSVVFGTCAIASARDVDFNKRWFVAPPLEE